MARRNDHSKDEIKSMAINAGLALITITGNSALSARKVATNIGYTVGTLYTVFENLDDLILHINATTLDLLLNQTSGAAQQTTGTDAIQAAAQAYLTVALQHPQRWKLVFEHSMSNNKPVPSWYQQKIDALFETIETLLDKPELAITDQTNTARILWAAVHGICILAIDNKLFSQDINPQQLITSLINRLLSGQDV